MCNGDVRGHVTEWCGHVTEWYSHVTVVWYVVWQGWVMLHV